MTSQNTQQGKWGTFIDFVKARPVMMIFAFICIAAGLVLCGVFIGKVLDPTEKNTYIYKNYTKSDLICSIVKDEYQKCVDDWVPYRSYCLNFVGKRCSDYLNCTKRSKPSKSQCSYIYGEDFKTCPCQVQSNIKALKISIFT